MNKPQLISEVKELLGNAETEEALNRLLEFLRSDPKYKELYNLALQARARFRKAQQEDIQGLASSEQTKLAYNQATRQALQVVQWLEEGNLNPDATFAEEKRQNRWPWVVGAIALLLIVAGGGYWWYRSLQGETTEPSAASCPVQFSSSSIFNILLMPFQALDDKKLRPHLTIAESLDEFKKKYNIQCDLELFPEDRPVTIATTDDASQQATQCQAQLIIWGTTEGFTDNAIIKTHYKFFNKKGKEEDNLELSKLEWTEGSELDTVRTLSSIATSGVLTQAIEESIKLLFGLIAHETGQTASAIEMLEGYEPADSAAHLVKGMVLAEDYLASKQEEKAWESYNEVLTIHPDYALARNNRGILNLKKENYEEAAEDLSVFLEKKPTDTVALEARGTAYLRAEQLKEAREDLQKVQKLKRIPDRELNQKLEEVDKKIREEENTKAAAEADLRANPNNLAAWNLKATTSIKLGDYREAVKAGEAILRRDPDNKDAFVQIIKAYRSAGDTAQVNKTIQRAEAAGISRRELDGLLPFKLIQPSVSRFPVERKID